MILFQIVERYERVTAEVATGIHVVRLKFGSETFTGTGPNVKAAKQNAAATALAQTKYQKPIEKKTMKVRHVSTIRHFYLHLTLYNQ